jgi:predicted GNAT family acetyltransferase
VTGQSNGDDVRVVDNSASHRWEAYLGGDLAGILVYRLRPGEITLIHTEVDPEFEGHGVGSRLARAALDEARAQGLGVVVACPFVRTYLRRHPEYSDIVRQHERTTG